MKVVESDGNAVLTFGASFKVNRTFKGIVGEYVMQFCSESTLKEIRNAGLIVASTKNTMFRYVLTRKDYDEVIQLRAASCDRYKEDADISELSDIYDSRSRILMASMKEKPSRICRGKCTRAISSFPETWSPGSASSIWARSIGSS